MLEVFKRYVKISGASYQQLDLLENLPSAILSYLQAAELSLKLSLDPIPEFKNLLWPSQLDVSWQTTYEEHCAGVCMASAGVAETGTLLYPSSSQHAASLSFLSKTQMAVVREQDIVPSLEDAFALFSTSLTPDSESSPRFESSATAANQAQYRMPRTLNLITGPSRTGDIEGGLYRGAHGPAHVHVLIIDSEPQN